MKLTPREFDVLLCRRDSLLIRQYDMPAAVIAQTIAEMWRDTKARPEPYTLGDFMVSEMIVRVAEEPLSQAKRLFDQIRAVNFHMGGTENLPDNIVWLE